jgi:hypothetical protein
MALNILQQARFCSTINLAHVKNAKGDLVKNKKVVALIENRCTSDFDHAFF